MRDIEEFKYGFGGKLKKIKTDDRSKPMLAKTKKGDKVCYIQVPSGDIQKEAKFSNNWIGLPRFSIGCHSPNIPDWRNR